MKVAVLLAAVLGLCACQARAEPAMWTVKDGDGTITLYGSVHLLPPELEWRAARFERAVADADEIWLEIPNDTGWSGQASAEAARRGALPRGERLTDLLSPDGRARLARLERSLNVAPDGVERMEPWLAEIALAVAFHRARGAVATAGVEEVLAEAAPEGVRWQAFETVSEQIDVFDAAPREAQVASLEYALKEMEQDPDTFQRLVRGWAAGDVCTLEREALEPLRTAAPVIYDRLITQRNRRWADRIAEMAKGSGEVLVVVGAGHLAGPDGVPEMLRARGLKVEGPPDRC